MSQPCASASVPPATATVALDEYAELFMISWLGSVATSAVTAPPAPGAYALDVKVSAVAPPPPPLPLGQRCTPTPERSAGATVAPDAVSPPYMNDIACAAA